ncbi:MAG: hypothetical protein P4K83_07530 [Terracidiphilus sp.]|nr:hypothetical protein [Terracidiphilus sp.]
MKVCSTVFILLIACSVAGAPKLACSQAILVPDAPSAMSIETTNALPEAPYSRPAHKALVANYAFDTFGPFAFASSGGTAGFGQWTNSPPEWRQGAEGYGRRFGSDFGMNAAATTMRFALAEALREDSLYYRCECSGFFLRLRHAMLSTVTARHGQDGRRFFSMSAIVAPYAGSSVAVYGWYPDRYGAKDAFRIGNYNLLGLAGGNVAMEFLYSGPHTLLSRIHLNSRRGSPEPGPNR